MNLNILVIILSSIIAILSIRLWRTSLTIKKIMKSSESIYDSAKKLMKQNSEYIDICNKQTNYIIELKGIIKRQNDLLREDDKINYNNIQSLDIDEILYKIQKSGLESITKEEINFLKNYKNL
jgi:hypothetical protein